MGFYSSYSGNNKQVVNVEFVLKMLDKLIPPVGFIYISVSSANPSTIYPGTTWVAWGSGRVPVGVNTSDTEFNSVEKTGGEKTHTLTVTEMPSHNHLINDPGHYHKFYDRWSDGAPSKVNDTLRMANINDMGTNTTSSKTGITIQSAGSGSAHNNLQPYITCYMWKRTA
jgi:hypothetical protein